jgi:hypothetical protein
MRYMFLIYSQEQSEPLAPEQAQTLMNNHWAVMQDAQEKGILVGVDALKPTNTATTVRVSGGGALTTDGPFAETKEQLAGYYILECKDLDDAIEWAKRIPTGCKGAAGCIEIRPVHDLPQRP